MEIIRRLLVILRILLGIFLMMSGALLILFEIGMAASERDLMKHSESKKILMEFIGLGLFMIFSGFMLARKKRLKGAPITTCLGMKKGVTTRKGK